MRYRLGFRHHLRFLPSQRRHCLTRQTRLPVLQLPALRFSQPLGRSVVKLQLVSLFHPTGTIRVHGLQSFHPKRSATVIRFETLPSLPTSHGFLPDIRRWFPTTLSIRALPPINIPHVWPLALLREPAPISSFSRP